MTTGVSLFQTNRQMNAALVGPTLYLALWAGDPTDTGTAGAEVTGAGYARQVIDFSTVTSGQAQNTNNVTFPNPTADWGPIDHWGIFDAISGGNLLYFGPFDDPLTILNGDTPPEVEVGGISIIED